MPTSLFDTWTERYDSWFTTPMGRKIRKYESALLLDLLDPQPGELILDAGCGTGLFTLDVLARGARIVGIDLSRPMLAVAGERLRSNRFTGLCADMCALPFGAGIFDRLFSMTAIEFVADAGTAISEFERVTRPGGSLVVATLNSLSPWAELRRKKGQEGHDLFQQAVFRSPAEMRELITADCRCRTAIHFRKKDPLEQIPLLEEEGNRQKAETGAMLAVQWQRGE